MDRAPLRGMVLNALILLYGYCQGWCRVRGGKDHTALAPDSTPFSCSVFNSPRITSTRRQLPQRELRNGEGKGN